MSDLRIGLVGCGGIGGVHLRSWAKVDGAKVVAACDADAARAEATGAAPFAEFRAMLAQAELDAVDICTPPALHAEVARAAAGRGLPVICEKPLARNPEEAREMVETAERAGTLLMTAFCHRFHPPVEFVRGLLQEGKLGRVLQFRNRFGALQRGIENKWFANREVAGGGALMDTSIHSVDLFRYLVGEVRAAAGAVHAFNPQITSVEDTASMLLTAEDGAIGVIEASWISPGSANVIEIYGERGVAVIDYNTGETRYQLVDDNDWTVAETGSGDRFQAELRHFAAVVRGEEQPRATARDGLRAVEVVYEAYRNRMG